MGRTLESVDRMSALRVRDVTMIAAMGVAGGGEACHSMTRLTKTVKIPWVSCAWTDLREKASRITTRTWREYEHRIDPLRRVISALCAEHGYHDVAEALEDVATDYTEPPSE